MDIQVFVAWPGSGYSLFYCLYSLAIATKLMTCTWTKSRKLNGIPKKKKKSPMLVGGPLISVRLAWDDAALFHVPLIFLVAGLGRSANTPLVRTSPALPTVERKRWYWKGMAKGESQDHCCSLAQVSASQLSLGSLSPHPQSLWSWRS